MHAIMYLIRKQYINSVKRAFSSVLSTVLTILAFLTFGFIFIGGFFVRKDKMIDLGFIETLLSGILLFIGTTMYYSLLTKDSGILRLSDANFLFAGPFEKREVLAYLLLTSAPASLITSIFMCFYLPFLLGPALTASDFVLVILSVSFMYGGLYLSYYYIYIVDTAREGFKKKVKAVLLILLAVLFAVFMAVLTNNDFNIQKSAQLFFTNWLYNLVPLFGWTKWAVFSLVQGNIITGFIPALTLLAVSDIGLALLLYNVKADFYEKAMHDSANLQRVMEQFKSGHADQRSFLKLKNRRIKTGFGRGAAAIYSKHHLESKKIGIMANYRELVMGLFYIGFGVVFKMGFEFVVAMVGFASLTMSLNESWHADFKKPYVFLIPENSFKKVIYSVLPGLQKSIFCGIVSIIISGFVFRQQPVNVVSYIIIFISFGILFVFAEIITYRILGGGVSTVVMVFIRMLFAIFTCLPAFAGVAVIAVIIQDIPGILPITCCMLITNIIISAILALLSRGIFEKSEIMG